MSRWVGSEWAGSYLTSASGRIGNIYLDNENWFVFSYEPGIMVRYKPVSVQCGFSLDEVQEILEDNEKLRRHPQYREEFKEELLGAFRLFLCWEIQRL